MQGILGKHSEAVANGTIQQRVKLTQGLVDIAEYASTLDRDNRKLSVTMTINTIYGPTKIQLQNYVYY